MKLVQAERIDCMFNGLGLTPNQLWKLSDAKTRSISPENPTGAVAGGARAEAEPNSPARELGLGWKCRPCIWVKPGETLTLADIEDQGAIQSMWFAGHIGRDFILRIYWEGNEQPSVECPLSDFFATPYALMDPAVPTKGPFAQISSLMVAVNPNRGMNCFWEMPFKKKCLITLENIHPTQDRVVYFQINYTLTEVPEDAAYFHAQFRRQNPLPFGEVYTIVDNISGKGQYVGTSMGWGINNSGWWGEGEIKFYMDGDEQFPTICGTGTEDYFGGAFNWEVDGQYTTYTTPYMGMHQVLTPDGLYKSQHRHAMYRWHVVDPIRFNCDLKVTIQALGWRDLDRFYPGTHDICSVAFWYQDQPAKSFPSFPSRDEVEIV